MKIRTKFLAAVLAIATAFSCALTASAWDKEANAAPAVEFGNSAMPGKTNSDGTATATLTLKSSDFEDVTGAKLTVKLPAEMTLVDASVTGNGSWVEGTDYKVVTGDAGTITLVNVFNVGDAEKNLSVYLELTVSGYLKGEITVSGEFADKNVDKVYTYDEVAKGTLTLTRSEESYATAALAQEAISNLEEGYFIPAGGVYAVVDGKYVYADKDDNGFNLEKLVDSKVKILTCPLPTDDKKVTTFGNSGKKAADPASEGYGILPEYEKHDGIQFGSYAINKELTYGTLIIMGDYNAFKNTVASTTGDNDFLNKVATNYKKVVDKRDDLKMGDPVTFKYGTANSEDERPYITVTMVDRTTAMWEGDSALQYAVRLYKLTEGRSYTGVAYSAGEDNYTFSAEIQTKVYNQEGWAE